ncbi:hypothetical protein [Treponema sp.]|uniref:hypothetical protein n=1 Tax=Treponema sp. TaxID=166 RepID=UPI00298E96DB|nr:hypothetical protein [Treponema sp.]MCQ2240427.1 hypothetical protein [Treponema sp.]
MEWNFQLNKFIAAAEQLQNTEEHMENQHDYDDMLNLPHPDSANHKRMEPDKRAAQFAPFAALTGYETSIENTAREFEKEVLDREKGTLLFEST